MVRTRQTARKSALIYASADKLAQAKRIDLVSSESNYFSNRYEIGESSNPRQSPRSDGSTPLFTPLQEEKKRRFGREEENSFSFPDIDAREANEIPPMEENKSENIGAVLAKMDEQREFFKEQLRVIIDEVVIIRNYLNELGEKFKEAAEKPTERPSKKSRKGRRYHGPMIEEPTVPKKKKFSREYEILERKFAKKMTKLRKDFNEKFEQLLGNQKEVHQGLARLREHISPSDPDSD